MTWGVDINKNERSALRVGFRDIPQHGVMPTPIQPYPGSENIMVSSFILQVQFHQGRVFKVNGSHSSRLKNPSRMSFRPETRSELAEVLIRGASRGRCRKRVLYEIVVRYLAVAQCIWRHGNGVHAGAYKHWADDTLRGTGELAETSERCAFREEHHELGFTTIYPRNSELFKEATCTVLLGWRSEREKRHGALLEGKPMGAPLPVYGCFRQVSDVELCTQNNFRTKFNQRLNIETARDPNADNNQTG
ncbi:hypothetical protein B0H17DRAFT_1124996 [Mycena rosella]|uniref:Uncharacterized protein n=1 Tax=Mycena rosella TaxID=1033263 RepID=A0AAD7GYP4_MYCRO|nr:hypothetical protein B0H17DRAFT_1124996 [Mycena rosella]